MPIRWDTLLARHTARELDQALAGSALRAIRLDRVERDLMLLFKDRTLVWRLHPTRGHVRILGAVEPVATDHRFRCPLRGVESPADERLVRLRFSPCRSGPVSVFVELISTQWNAVVVEGDGEVVRHLLWNPKREERRIIGQRYVPPPPTERAGATREVTLEEWRAELEPHSGRERERTLLQRFAWTSRINARAFLGAGPEPQDRADLSSGYQRWRSITDPTGSTDPVILESERGLQPYPFPLTGTPSRPVVTLLEAFAQCATEEEGSSWAAATLGHELLERLEARVGQAARRLTSLEAELAGLPEPDELRAAGDLILARYHEVPAGASSATLPGFDGEPVEVELDPAEPAHANASRYYERAAKSERAALRLPELVERARRELRRLEDLVGRARQGSVDQAEILDEVGHVAPPAGRRSDAVPLPYRSFWSSGGLEIRVGRGSRHNDDLTFRHSAPNDIWLHARHAAGAHVVLRWTGEGRPPARDLEEAATLAALHSKARTSGSVPVDWTRRKYVRKPRKSPPGRVAMERAETLFVTPDESLIETLSDRPGTRGPAVPETGP